MSRCLSQGPDPLWILIGLSLLIGGGGAFAQPADGGDRPVWEWQTRLSTGYDVFTQTYQLALEDTTETISEMEAVLDAELGTTGRRVHNWRLRPLMGVGTERNRQQFAWDYALKPDLYDARLRFSGTLQARQYRGTTDYNLSSDNLESSANLRWSPTGGETRRGELRLNLSTLDYADPSLLEVNRREAILGAYLKSGPASERIWRVGLRGGQRVYPDSSSIDRNIAGVELEYDHNTYFGPGLRVNYRGERRDIADQSARPSSWGHWTSLEFTLPVGDERIVADLRNEIWRYDTQWGAFANQLRWIGTAGLRGGGLDGPGWLVMMTYEDLDSDSGDDSFRQLGIRGGVEHFGQRLSGEMTLEAGRRNYADAAVDSLGVEESYALYTDFTYLEVWINGSWRFSERLSLDAMVNYVPESHSEDMDNQAMGFGNLRIMYRF